jgi:hypothetical protein
VTPMMAMMPMAAEKSKNHQEQNKKVPGQQ